MMTNESPIQFFMDLQHQISRILIWFPFSLFIASTGCLKIICLVLCHLTKTANYARARTAAAQK